MKKVVVVLLITMILTMTTSFADTYQEQYDDYALKLKEIGVFKGTDSGFELDREPTRIEAAVMFVRLLGAEQEAQERKYEHPFTDVPEWGNDYVGYLYHEGLTNGTSETTFGSNDNINAKSFITFILRALGYKDSEGDFSWDSALEFANENQLINENDYIELTKNTFLRDHVAKISYLALQMQVRENEIKLIDKLIDTKAIDKRKAEEIGLVDKITHESISDNTIIDIEDPELKSSILYYLGFNASQNITFKDMKKLTILYAHNVENLKGIEYAVNLESLHLKDLACDNNSLFYIKNLTKLKELEIEIFYDSKYVGNISDIRFIENLTNLEKLSLHFNLCKPIDVKVLRNNQNLKELKLTMCSINDMSSLGTLINLEKLDLIYTQIADYSVLNSFKKLKSLYIKEGSYESKLELSDLPNLKTINLGKNSRFKTLKLNNLPSLKTVFNMYGKISEISLNNVEKLESLQLLSNKIENIASIENAENLERLSLPNNKIKDINALKTLKNLKYLWLSGNPLNDDAINIIKSLYKNVYIYVDEQFNPINQEVLLSDEQTLELNSEIIQRLQSYPYKDGDVKYDFKQLGEDDPRKAEKILDDFWGISSNIFENNEEFSTSPKLIYITSDYTYVVRGILKSSVENGNINEQYVDIYFGYHPSATYTGYKFLESVVEIRTSH